MKLPSGLHIPDSIPNRHLLLPTLAGGAGWDLIIPETNKFVELGEKGTPGLTFTLAPFSLLTENSPTIMEAWRITDIRIPTVINLKAGIGKLSSPVFFTCTAIIRRSGSIVWSQTIESKTQEESEGKNQSWFNFIFADNLINPIELNRGAGLTLEILTVLLGSAESIKKIGTAEVTISSMKTKNEGYVITQGNIQYDSKKLSGHRTL